MARKQKASNLTPQKRLTIGKFKSKNLNMTYYELADKYHCTYHQARGAYIDYRDGKLTRTKSRINIKDVKEIMLIQTADELLEKQYHTAIAALEIENKISIEDRVKLLESLFSMRKILQQLNIEKFMKNTDAGVVRIIIQKYVPDLTNDEFVKIYLEAKERWKIERKMKSFQV